MGTPSRPVVSVSSPRDGGGGEPRGPKRVALLGNPNTGKTTLFNRLTGLRQKTSNFPGTTLDARIGRTGPAESPIDLIDLPGVYSLSLDQLEARVCREALEGTVAVGGRTGEPDALCVVVDATNLARNLRLAGEVLRRRMPTVVAVNMIDLARKRGLRIDEAELAKRLGCTVVACSARTGEGLGALAAQLGAATIPSRTPPGDEESLFAWADEVYAAAAAGPVAGGAGSEGRRAASAIGHTFSDKLDRFFAGPLTGLPAFALIMGVLFMSIFSIAAWPMEWIGGAFDWLAGVVRGALPAGLVSELLTDGIISGVSATVVFLPQICLLFFLISLLEDTGYLARAAFLMNRLLAPFGLQGHSFVPLLSSHACALPGIMSARAVPDPKQRLATILVAPFMTCSARLPVYVLLTGLLFPGKPVQAALAFVGCYALGIAAAMVSSLIARRTILRGQARPMALELPSYKLPSVRTALLTTLDRGWVFVKNAGTNILCICIVLWWLGAFPKVEPPASVLTMREQAAAVVNAEPERAAELAARADRMEAADAKSRSFMGSIGRFVQPVFAPMDYDWRLSVGVMASFAAREVFVSTMSIVTTGADDPEAEGVLDEVAKSTRDDGRTLIFTPPVAWSLLVFFVLAMQCLPTLAVTARESGHVKWALLQLAWMSGVAYGAAWIAFKVAGG
ncbi:MAG: ferrous iron transporter B [Phycisphaerales bacterium]